MLCALFGGLAGAGSAQTLVLDSFNSGATTGSVRPGTSWVGNVTPNASTITVGGAARDDNGWGATGQTINATGLGFISITAQRDAGNTAPTLTIQFEDRNLNTQVFSVSTASFAEGALSQVQIAIGSWASGFDPANIRGWSLGGGGLGATAFRMTFDQLALAASSNPNAAVAPTVSGTYGASTRTPGESITFTVTATGSAPLSYQWRKDSVAIASATTASLVFSNLAATDGGTYTCTVTNSAGSAVSGAFVLTVNATPATIVLGNLAASYKGTALGASAVTTPAGLPVVFTYNGSVAPPVNAGSYAVVATINHPVYTGRVEGTLVVAKATQAVAFAPLPATVQVGVPFAVGATATSGGPVTIAVLAGNATIAGNTVTTNTSAAVTLRATQGGDANFLSASTDFVFTTSKLNQSITFPAIAAPAAGATGLTLGATASSGLPVTFSLLSGPGILSGTRLTMTGTGTFVVRASQPGNDAFNAAPSVDRSVEVLSLVAPPVPPVDGPPTAGRLINLSILAPLAAGETMTLGTVLGGSGTTGFKPLVVRAAGPALTQLNVTGVLPDPKMTLNNTSATPAVVVATNDDWAGTVELTNAFAQVGAFPYASAASKDAGLFRSALPIGNYTVQISDTGSGAGAVIAELYDATPAGAFTATTPRLINVSVLKGISAGSTLTAGFVIDGTTSRTVLIRAVGPTLGLTPFNLGGVMADPKLELFNNATGTKISENDDWAAPVAPLTTTSAQLSSVFASVAAFALANAQTKDAVLLVTLAPGQYSARVTGADGGGGTAIVEVYEVP